MRLKVLLVLSLWSPREWLLVVLPWPVGERSPQEVRQQVEVALPRLEVGRQLLARWAQLEEV
jgi:hypothetical protein